MKTRINLCKEWKMTERAGEVRFIFPAPEGAGIRPYGFDTVNEKAADVMGWHGFWFRLVTGSADVDIDISAGFANGCRLHTGFTLAEPGEHLCGVGLEDFEVERAKTNIWRELTDLEIRGEVRVLAAELMRRSSLFVETGVCGKSGDAGETVEYTVTVHNCQSRRQRVKAVQAVEGWESMYARIEPERFLLEPYGSQAVQVSVMMHDDMPRGAREKTVVRLIPEGDSAGAEEVSFWTLRRLGHPYIYHTREKWQEVAANIRNEEVFQAGYNKLKQDADSWMVTPPVPFGERDYCYDTGEEHFIMSCAYVYSITGEHRYAEKIADFFRYFADAKTGYPVRKKGCSQSYVQEGHFFQHLALSYDMIFDSGVLTKKEHDGIEKCFRIYMEILDRHIRSGHISNWTLSELTGAV